MYSYLLVDDEVLIRKGTLKKIEKLALPVHCQADVSNGQEAIDILTQQDVDFIITDMDMPILNGVDFLDYLQKENPQLPVIVISGYRNFDYMQKSVQANAVNYILKPFSKDDLLQSLTIVLTRIEAARLEQANRDEAMGNYLIGNASELGHQAINKALSNMKKPRLALLETPNMLLKSPSFSYSIPNTQLMIILCDDSYIDELQQANLIGGVSEPICPEKQMASYYHQCISALNSRTKDSPQVSFFQAATSARSIDLQEFFPFSAEIQYLVENGDSHKIKILLPKYFQQGINKGASLLEMKKSAFNLLERVKHTVDDLYHFDTNYTLPNIYFELMERMFRFEEVTTYTATLLSNIAEAFSYEKLYASEDVIKNVQTYLKLHFKERITLDLVADLFYLNHSYLSTLFKERTGIKYIDYLNTLRITEAQRLLQNSTKKTSQIAREVGYENEKYFFRVFKRYTEMTPEQFRKNSSKE